MVLFFPPRFNTMRRHRSRKHLADDIILLFSNCIWWASAKFARPEQMRKYTSASRFKRYSALFKENTPGLDGGPRPKARHYKMFTVHLFLILPNIFGVCVREILIGFPHRIVVVII